MKRFLYQIALWGFLIFVGLNLIAFASLYSLGRSCLYKPQYLQNGVPEDKFDYLVLGSSTGLTTLNTIRIDSLTGYNGLNMSMDDTSMSAHYLILQHFYALGKTAGKVILTITPWDASDRSPTLGNNDYRFMTYRDEEYVNAYYEAIETGFYKPLSWSKYVPLFGVSYYNTEVFYPSVMTAFKPVKRNRFDEKGNYTYPTDKKNYLKEAEITNAKVSIVNPYFKKIKKLCTDNNSKLVIYIAPLYRQHVTFSNQFDSVVNHSNLLQDSELFYDEIHVNKKGRRICSDVFSKELIKLTNAYGK